MPEINPLSNEQIFLKKIAENTGSNYNTGDVSEINPLTIDQILLKEIAANTAGQSGDITELEGKVADNTSAIEAIVNEYGAKNLLPNNATSQTINGVTFTVNADGSVEVNGTASALTLFSYNLNLSAGSYVISGCPQGGSAETYYTSVHYDGSYATPPKYDTGNGSLITVNSLLDAFYIIIENGVTVSNLVFYPMIRDARITDPTYVPYAMTNAELTDAVSEHKVYVVGDGVKTIRETLYELYGLVDRNKLNPKSIFYYKNTAGRGFNFYLPLNHITSSKIQFASILDANNIDVYSSIYILNSNLSDNSRYDYTLITNTITDQSLTIASVDYEFGIVY